MHKKVSWEERFQSPLKEDGIGQDFPRTWLTSLIAQKWIKESWHILKSGSVFSVEFNPEGLF